MPPTHLSKSDDGDIAHDCASSLFAVAAPHRDICAGSHSDSSGKAITIARTTNMIRWNGMVPSTTSDSLPSQMLWMTNRLMPIGGEICPSSTIDDEDDAEQDRVDAVARQHRIEQRHGDDDHAEALDQAAQHREQHEQRQVEFELGSFRSMMNLVTCSPRPAKLSAVEKM